MITKEVKPPEILCDLTEKALAKAVIENCYARTPFSHAWPGAEIYKGTDVDWCLTHVAYPACNPVLHVNIAPERIGGFLQSLTEKAKKRKVNLHCQVNAETRPADLGKYLTAHGFTYSGAGPCMAADLQALKEQKTAPQGFRILEIRDYAGLKKWCQIKILGFGQPAYMEPALVEWMATDMGMKQPMKLYLGLLDGRPVATSAYYLGAGVVGIYSVSVLPEARNRGIGYAMTLRPLLDARMLGYRAGVLQASNMGLPVYRKMGFKEYGQVASYRWFYEQNKGDKNGYTI
jgi:ribosomal protein S18 acetylase RimI-like enzyme